MQEIKQKLTILRCSFTFITKRQETDIKLRLHTNNVSTCTTLKMHK